MQSQIDQDKNQENQRQELKKRVQNMLDGGGTGGGNGPPALGVGKGSAYQMALGGGSTANVGSDQSGMSPSVSDLTLAGVGTLGYLGEKLSQNILDSRSGYSSGKMFPRSPSNYSKATAKNVKIGFKVGGWALTLYGIYDTENQFQNGQIGPSRRKLNHLNNGVGVLFPVIAIPLAAGDYLGQTYSDEIYKTTAQPGGFFYETTKWMIETIGIPTGLK
jgi:hypothetical protein